MSASAPRMPSFDALYAEICALPEGKTGMILEPGRLTVMPRPHPKHQRAMMGLFRGLASRDTDAGGSGWWLLAEVEVRLDDRLLVPDIVGYRVERVPELPSDNPLRIVPDWACEIISPSSARDDRLKKLRIYASYGVRWTWIVDPDARTVECYEAVDRLPTQTVVAEPGETVSLPPFDLPLEIDTLWGAGPQVATAQK
ncbi:MAG: Uma2 family endonuclease [Myxococcales bacterium]|nr:Uma2 family endonuclease [Myxococcales bacterium]